MNPESLLQHLSNSSFLKTAGFSNLVNSLKIEGHRIDFSAVTINSYLASVMVDFLRLELLASNESFTFETVMSHPSKIELLKIAREQGYRIYLYFVSTDSPSINQSRVRNRVLLGGHSVPEDKIEARYHRSLALLPEAIKLAHRAYIFDNSGENPDHNHTWLAEITNGETLEVKTDEIPSWFEDAVITKLI